MRIKLYAYFKQSCLKYFLFGFCFAFLNGCVTTEENTLQQKPTETTFLNQVDPSILNAKLFSDAPIPHAQDMKFVAFRASDKTLYSHYNIHLAKTLDQVTQFNATEDLQAGSSINENGLTYSGIFPIALNKKHSLLDNTDRPFRLKMAAVTNVKGKLFPLKKGNTLRFDYTETQRHMNTDNQNTNEVLRGAINYTVTDVLNGFKNNYVEIPGNIYVISVSKSINDGPQNLVNQFYYSDQLGWFVSIKHYERNELKTIYNLVNYENTLALWHKKT